MGAVRLQQIVGRRSCRRRRASAEDADREDIERSPAAAIAIRNSLRRCGNRGTAETTPVRMRREPGSFGHSARQRGPALRGAWRSGIDAVGARRSARSLRARRVNFEAASRRRRRARAPRGLAAQSEQLRGFRLARRRAPSSDPSLPTSTALTARAENVLNLRILRDARAIVAVAVLERLRRSPAGTDISRAARGRSVSLLRR